MLYLPDSRTRSVTLRPWLANSDWSVVKLLVGAGILFKASDAFDTVPSRRPVGTDHEGPPCVNQGSKFVRTEQNQGIRSSWRLVCVSITVATMASLATNVIMSAQDTMPGHAVSTRLLTLSMKAKPLTVRFGVASLSAWFPEVAFRSTDASQPCKRQ